MSKHNVNIDDKSSTPETVEVRRGRVKRMTASFSLPIELIDRLDEIAYNTRRSKSSIISEILEKGVTDYE